ncbi:hypothetical protein CR513_62150, partial [Mucuna pruriens]
MDSRLDISINLILYLCSLIIYCKLYYPKVHQESEKIKWVLFRQGLHWPSILKDCINYAKLNYEFNRLGSSTFLKRVFLKQSQLTKDYVEKL